MPYDPADTIAAIASASGPAARGIVRISGAGTISCLASNFHPTGDQSLDRIDRPQSVVGYWRLPKARTSSSVRAAQPELPCEVLIWPDERSYTGEPVAELQLIGSPPLLECVVEQLCSAGARIAERGEFTLRAFLAGKIDLTQAEAVLAVIDATNKASLHVALQQLAGGLAQPLTALREELLDLLADLEAGLDFVDEDIEFITQDRICRKLRGASEIVEAAAKKLATRRRSDVRPRVVLQGLPNAGKSSLFNALTELHGEQARAALVAADAGTTRDFLTAPLRCGSTLCELIDTAGTPLDASSSDPVAQASYRQSAQQGAEANLALHCHDCREGLSELPLPEVVSPAIVVLTKADTLTSEQRTLLAAAPDTSAAGAAVLTSSKTGEGLEVLRERIALALLGTNGDREDVVASTAERCRESLAVASTALRAALELIENGGGEELVAEEVRAALIGVGEVVGAVYTDDVLDRIFGRFCIGK